VNLADAVPVPVNPFERNADLRLAAMLVVLVVVPGALERVRAAAEPAAPREAAAPRGRARTRTAKGRHIRPPRSC
jgi:hypothetical protein